MRSSVSILSRRPPKSMKTLEKQGFFRTHIIVGLSNISCFDLIQRIMDKLESSCPVSFSAAC